MGFLINNQGERVNVDVEEDWFSRNVVLYADDAGLRDLYILNLYHGRCGSKKLGDVSSEPELLKQVEYRDNPPTKDQIMYEMNKAGLSRYDLATIEKGYMLDWLEQ